MQQTINNIPDWQMFVKYSLLINSLYQWTIECCDILYDDVEDNNNNNNEKETFGIGKISFSHMKMEWNSFLIYFNRNFFF